MPGKPITSPDPTQRFSSRVENYVKYRPSYPHEIVETLQVECQLASASLIADIGSGTGLLTRLFLQNGNRVLGVEPNREMREAGAHLLTEYARFTSIAAPAEATTLDNHSVDFITVGQAFHWFELERARAEFLRILKPQGWVTLIWNVRCTGSTPFLAAYEQLLHTYAVDYESTRHTRVDADALQSFFGHRTFKLKTFRNDQTFDLDGLKGRLLSSSYAPEAGHPKHEPMLKTLSEIFEAHQAGGQIVFEYDTYMYYGQLEVFPA